MFHGFLTMTLMDTRPGELTVCYGKIHYFIAGKIHYFDWAIFNCYVSMFTRGYPLKSWFKKPWNMAIMMLVYRCL